MTFLEIYRSLPNGFHDAELLRLDMDYARRRLQFDIVVWIGSMEDVETRDLYRPARLTVDDVAFLVIESPDPNYSWCAPGPIRIDAGEGKPQQSESVLPEAPAGTSITWMYLRALNRFLLFAARSASLEWTGLEENRT